MKINANGKEYNYPKDRDISYNDVFALCYPDRKYFEGQPQHFLMTYSWKGDGDLKRQGIISSGESIKPADGMVFNCYDTSNA